MTARFLSCMLLAFAAPALSGMDDKSAFHLFNPTPAPLLREMSTDRPDTTESPISVDAGHCQVEMSFFDFSRDLDRGSRSSAWSFGQINFNAGLTNTTDLQFIFDSYTADRQTAAGLTANTSGFSDVTLRLKTNLWGNDGGATAFGLMPYVSIPTGTRISPRRAAGGLILPFAAALGERITLGVMAEADFVPDDIGSGYDAQWVHSATVAAALTKNLGLYLEGVGIAAAGGFAYQGYFNSGLTLSLTPNLALDAGVRLGLNRAAQDFGVFSGLSVRF